MVDDSQNFKMKYLSDQYFVANYNLNNFKNYVFHSTNLYFTNHYIYLNLHLSIYLAIPIIFDLFQDLGI